MTLLKFLRRRRAQQLADAQADLAIARGESFRYCHALAWALVLAEAAGADVSGQWSAWARGRLQGQVDNHPEDGRSAVEVIDEAIGVDDDDDELDGLKVTRR